MTLIGNLIPAEGDNGIPLPKLQPDFPWFLFAGHGDHGLLSFRGTGFRPAIGIPDFECIRLNPVLCSRGALFKMSFHQADIGISIGTGKGYLIT